MQRTTQINATADAVFDVISDFGTWTTWSPWLAADPDAQVTVTDDAASVGSIYRWQGEIVGEGEIEHKVLQRPDRIEDELRFIKPWRSQAKTSFSIEPASNAAQVTWTMKGSLPWFMFWMVPMMKRMIAMDYDRGLRMLAEHVETGKVLSKTEIVGEVTLPAMDMIGQHGACDFADIGPAMEQAFSKACHSADASAMEEGDMISVYHKTDLKCQRFEFTSGFLVDAANTIPVELEHCHLPAGKALHVRHIGSYSNLGNAWSAAYQYARYKKLKPSRAKSFEIYRNNAAIVPKEDLITDVYIPLK
ncbi:MAG: GyrI-like domain-containing protein [Pirellulaceae bacterium]